MPKHPEKKKPGAKGAAKPKEQGLQLTVQLTMDDPKKALISVEFSPVIKGIDKHKPNYGVEVHQAEAVKVVKGFERVLTAAGYLTELVIDPNALKSEDDEPESKPATVVL